MNSRTWIRLGVAVVAVFVATAMLQPAPVSAAKKMVLKVGWQDPDTLDPHKSVLGHTQAIVRFIYRGLTRFAIKDGKVTTAEVQPDLAESWTVSEDGTVWTFKLRKGVQFHKGFGEFTAEDVKFSFQRQLERGTRFAKNLKVIKAITIIDPHTMRISLKGYDPVFPLRMAGYQQGYIISKKAAEKYGDEFGWNPVGTGPFYFHKHVPREKVVLRAHKEYYGGRPQIDEVHWFDVPEDATKLIGLEKGTFDLIRPQLMSRDVVAQIEKIGAVFEKFGPGGQYRFYVNHTKPPFDNIKVRQAFMHAINRPAIKETLYPAALGKLASSPLPPGYFGHIPLLMPEYNPILARKLLAEAGYPNGFTVKNYFITKSYAYPKIMVLVQEQLKKVGIKVELQMVEHATYHQNIRKNLNPFVLYGGTRLTDGDVMLGLFFHSSEAPDPATGNKGTNFAHYKGIDDLLDRGRQERDQAKRAKLYHEAQRRIMRDAVSLPLVDLPNPMVRNPKRVSTPFDPNYGEFALHYTYNYPEMLKIIE
ncbi:MAG: ABC transporter substrate-binding protein [Candidatus Methylomirabilales bacterium]